jgi:hypothetical protein
VWQQHDAAVPGQLRPAERDCRVGAPAHAAAARSSLSAPRRS